MSITIHPKDTKASHKMSKSKFAQEWKNVPILPKPQWLKIKLHNDPKVTELKNLLRQQNLVTVCEEASCPNLPECFGSGTATFMIMGDKCTRRCSFCDVAHGIPNPLDPQEPIRLAETIQIMNLKYVVITSVDRDDLRDGGAAHFAACIKEIRSKLPSVTIEILVPDFRKRQEIALDFLCMNLPDVFNHNIETVPRLYRQARPGSDYQVSLNLIKSFKEKNPNIPTKSGLMLGLGEEQSEIEQVLVDLRHHGCDWITIGQYLQPSKHHHPVMRYVTLEEFDEIKTLGLKLGFSEIASGPFVRSSYHADLMAQHDPK